MTKKMIEKRDMPPDAGSLEIKKTSNSGGLGRWHLFWDLLQSRIKVYGLTKA